MRWKFLDVPCADSDFVNEYMLEKLKLIFTKIDHIELINNSFSSFCTKKLEKLRNVSQLLRTENIYRDIYPFRLCKLQCNLKLTARCYICHYWSHYRLPTTYGALNCLSHEQWWAFQSCTIDRRRDIEHGLITSNQAVIATSLLVCIGIAQAFHITKYCVRNFAYQNIIFLCSNFLRCDFFFDHDKKSGSIYYWLLE